MSSEERYREAHRLFRHLFGHSMPLVIRPAQLVALDEMDYAELVEVHGASPAMLAQLRTMALDVTDPRNVVLDFVAQVAERVT